MDGFSKKIVLVNPPSPAGKTLNREGSAGAGAVVESEGGFVYPPQTIASVGAALCQSGFNVEVVDAVKPAVGFDKAVAAVVSSKPEVVGFLATVKTIEYDLEFARAVHRVLPEAKVIAFGQTAHLCLQQIEASGTVDFVVAGEPELRVAKYCAAGGPPPETEEWQDELFEPDLDSLPAPRWDLIRPYAYSYLTVSSSRGCDHGCKYCPYVLAQGTRLRSRESHRVVEEMEALCSTFGPRRIIFRDPVFARDRKRVVTLCRAIRGSSNSFEWECESRPDHLDNDLLDLMAKSGCVELKVGLESADTADLVAMGRVPSEQHAADYLASFQRLMNSCDATGVKVQVYVMVGLPGQAEASIRESVGFLRQFSAIDYRLKVKRYVHYPGTALWHERPDYCATATDWDTVVRESFEPLGKSSPARRATRSRIGTLLRRIVGNV